jgi:hydrogenase/urease accessory protein HupE
VLGVPLPVETGIALSAVALGAIVALAIPPSRLVRCSTIGLTRAAGWGKPAQSKVCTLYQLRGT